VVPDDRADGLAADAHERPTALVPVDYADGLAADDLGDSTTYLTEDDLRRLAISPTGPVPVPQRRLASGTLDGAPPVPRELGGYPVTGLLASGSMGVVYQGEHPTLGRPVAIKVLHPKLQQDPAVVARFFNEAVATERIDHPNVVSFFDFGYDAHGAAYLVLELLEGETLSSRLIRERRLDVVTALDIAIQVASALEAAHQQGVVHRDLKPDNIFLCASPAGAGSPTVKLLDFGVAKVAGHSPDTTHTLVGELLGTPSYMAPEQGLSAADSDARSDLYSLGCVLFEMVCGVRPFAGNLVETLLAHQTSKRPAARALNPAIPPALDMLIYRLIARDPDDRPGAVTDVVHALTAIKARARFRVVPSASRARASTERVVHRSAGQPAWRQDWRALVVLFALVLVVGIIAGALIARHRSSAGSAAPPSAPVTPVAAAAPRS